MFYLTKKSSSTETQTNRKLYLKIKVELNYFNCCFCITLVINTPTTAHPPEGNNYVKLSRRFRSYDQRISVCLWCLISPRCLFLDACYSDCDDVHSFILLLPLSHPSLKHWTADARSIDAGISIQTEVACAPITGTSTG